MGKFLRIFWPIPYSRIEHMPEDPTSITTRSSKSKTWKDGKGAISCVTTRKQSPGEHEWVACFVFRDRWVSDTALISYQDTEGLTL